MITRIALYTALGLVLTTLGATVDSAGFWCVVGLFWSAEHITRQEVYRDIEAEVERLRAERKSKDTQ